MTFADVLRRELDARGWSAADLANRAGVSRQYVHGILIGETTNPRIDKIYLIARALGTTLDELARKVYR